MRKFLGFVLIAAVIAGLFQYGGYVIRYYWPTAATPVVAAPRANKPTTVQVAEESPKLGCSPGDGTTPKGVDAIPEGPEAFGYWSIKAKADTWSRITVPSGSDTHLCMTRKKAVRFKFALLNGEIKEVEDRKLCSKDNSCVNDFYPEVDYIDFQAVDLEEEDYVDVRIYKR